MRTRLSRAGEAIRGRSVWWTGSGRRPMLVGAAACGAAICLGSPRPALAQVDATLNGAPIQVQPYVPEPGVPNFTVPMGTLNPPPPTGTGGTGPGSGGNFTGSEPLTTMMGTPWGIQAVGNAQSLGLNASALAATCVLESGCQNIPGGTYTGAFQMGTAAYQEGIAQAEAIDPSIASQVVSGDGRNDPTSAAIAASGYILQGAQSLQTNGIADPTVLDVRSYFNFGPSAGTQIALASADNPMSSFLSAAAMQQNGITSNESVGQWRSSITSKIGTAASQSVFST